MAVVLTVLVGGRAMSAQDRSTLQVPNGLVFSEFKGYEAWQTIALSGSLRWRAAFYRSNCLN
jgi:hypothetical protein